MDAIPIEASAILEGLEGLTYQTLIHQKSSVSNRASAPKIPRPRNSSDSNKNLLITDVVEEEVNLNMFHNLN